MTSENEALAEAQLDKVSQELQRAQQREVALTTGIRAAAEDLARIKFDLLSGIKLKVALGNRMTDAAVALDGVSQRLQAFVPFPEAVKK